MRVSQSNIRNCTPKDYLWLHLRDLPYFRALLRAMESRFYEGIDLPSPLLDLGCGDGHFAGLTFDKRPEIGVDSWWGPLMDAYARETYPALIMANGARFPFPDSYFHSVVSNSVLEHIPSVEDVLKEIARVLNPGSPFVFCVPNHNFLPSLSIGRFLDMLGLRRVGNQYRFLFNKISRHYHCDSPDIWKSRLNTSGFKIEKWWHYFSPDALKVLEWGHYFGLPSWIIKKFSGRWIISPSKWNLNFTRKMLQKHYDEPLADENGVYSFYIARRL